MTTTPPSQPAPPAVVDTAPKLAPTNVTYNALKTVTQVNLDLPRMKERHFREFVAWLYNPVADTFDRALWVRTFGSLRTAVTITDDADQAVFICPPLVGTVETTIGNDFSHMGIASNNLEKRLPILGEKHRQDRLPELSKQLVTLSPRERWVAVLARYGITPPKAEGDKAPAEQSLQDMFLGLDE